MHREPSREPSFYNVALLWHVYSKDIATMPLFNHRSHALGAGCRRFESCHPDSEKSPRNSANKRFPGLFSYLPKTTENLENGRF